VSSWLKVELGPHLPTTTSPLLKLSIKAINFGISCLAVRPSLNVIVDTTPALAASSGGKNIQLVPPSFRFVLCVYFMFTFRIL
jgi:hypothetical protein